MSKEWGREMSYVERVHDDTRRYVEKLLSENESLRRVNAQFEADKVAMEEELVRIRQKLDGHRAERSQLERRLAEIEAENEKFNQEYRGIERENNNLVNLYVASYRLHGTLDRREVLEIVQEILINLVGSEEIGIFEIDDDGATAHLISSFGIDTERYGVIPLGNGVMAGTAKSGEKFIGDGTGEEGITACLPLHVGDAVTGLIVVFGLLPHKPALEPVDLELFELLGTHAAMALYCTGLHEKTGVHQETA